MAAARENLKEDQKTESRSIEEPKIQTLDRILDARKRENKLNKNLICFFNVDYDDSTRFSQETKDFSLRLNETCQTRREHEQSPSLPHKERATILDWRTPSESLKQQQESLRDVEMQRISHETESTFMQHKNRDTTLDWGKNESNRRFDERNESDYPLCPEERACSYYTKTGLCGYGRNCVLNHPRCKYFMRGDCKHGSTCMFIHPKNMDRIYETESSTRPEKRAKPNYPETLADLGEGEIPREQENMKSPWILRLEKRYNRDISEIIDGIVAGITRTRMEKERNKDNEKQRRERDEC